MERRKFSPEFKLEAVKLVNILDRVFVASAPNQKWIADFTYFWTPGRPLLSPGQAVLGSCCQYTPSRAAVRPRNIPDKTAGIRRVLTCQAA
jgi:transposase InsO family protein